MALLKQMMAGLRGGEPKKALQAYEQLPPALKGNKKFLVMRLQAAKAVSDDEYVRAVEDLRTHYPQGTSTDLFSMDGYLLTGQWDQALACVDRVDAAVGGDPYLDVVRAEIHIKNKNLDTARRCARKASDQEPGLEDAFWPLITISLEEKNFDETLVLLKTIQEKFGGDLHDISEQPEYAEFIKSPQYRLWLKARREKGTGEKGKP